MRAATGAELIYSMDARPFLVNIGIRLSLTHYKKRLSSYLALCCLPVKTPTFLASSHSLQLILLKTAS